MNFRGTSTKCFVCEAPLKLWQLQACTRCGKAVCSQHAHLLKHRHSYVLYSICTRCFDANCQESLQLVGRDLHRP